jgi:hypothetical protein
MFRKIIKAVKSLFLFLSLTKADIILISIIFLSAFGSLFWLFSKDKASDIVVRHNQEVLFRESLNQNKVIDIDSLAVLEIKQGKVRMLKSTCKNQHCVHQGWSDSEPIICVPNKIIIEFISNEKIKKQDFFITR